MGENTSTPILGVLIACVAASVLLVVFGMWLRRSGKLRSRGVALVWAILCLVPLFGAGLAMFTRHSVDLATGETRSGVNEPPPSR